VVEGAHLATGRDDPAEHSIHVLQYVASGYTHDAETFTPHQCITRGIAPGLIAETVPPAIHFYDQAPLQTREVSRNLPNRKLASKLQPLRPLP
jgi:hypothetical protein